MRQGGLRDAILHSVGANATHGLRRTSADKRRAVAILLEDELVSTDPEMGAPWSNREIARRCAVSADMVDRLRPVICPKQADAPRTVERGGTVYEMKPRASAKPAGPEPEPSAPAGGRWAEALIFWQQDRQVLRNVRLSESTSKRVGVRPRFVGASPLRLRKAMRTAVEAAEVEGLALSLQV